MIGGLAAQVNSEMLAKVLVTLVLCAFSVVFCPQAGKVRAMVCGRPGTVAPTKPGTVRSIRRGDRPRSPVYYDNRYIKIEPLKKISSIINKLRNLTK
jgi:hypothetical protein